MKPGFPIRLATGLAALSLAACGGNFKKSFGLQASPPDAFAVGAQPPLALPPELGQLPPPTPGAPPLRQINPAQQGLNTLSPQSSLAQSGPATAGEASLLDQAGPKPPAGIRQSVAQSGGSGVGAGDTVDAAAETRRLQENAALGQPVTYGETPADDSRRQGLLHRFFNLF